MSDPTPPGPPLGPPQGPPPPAPPPVWQSASYPEPPRPPGRSRGRTVLLIGLALVAALAVVGAAFLLPGVLEDLRDEGGVASPEIDAPTMDDVLVVPDLSTEHRDDEDVDYPESPPVGGPHDDEWLACGTFDEPVRDENVVHDLEHGTVWITYDPGALDQDDIGALEADLPANGILSPYPGLPAPVVVTVWGAQLRLTGAGDPRLPRFIEAYGDGSTAPEPFASCEGGLEDPQGDQEGVDA